MGLRDDREKVWMTRTPYCAVIVPRIPATACAGIEHSNWYVPGLSSVEVPAVVCPPSAMIVTGWATLR